MRKVQKKPRAKACTRGLDSFTCILSTEILPQAHAGIIIIAIIYLISLDDQHVIPLWEVLMLNIIAIGSDLSRFTLSRSNENDD